MDYLCDPSDCRLMRYDNEKLRALEGFHIRYLFYIGTAGILQNIIYCTGVICTDNTSIFDVHILLFTSNVCIRIEIRYR